MIIRVPSDALAKVTDAIKNDKEVKIFALETWYRYMFPYIPFRTGVLASTTHLKYQTGDMIKEVIEIRDANGKVIDTKIPSVSVKGDGIHFNVPYASRMYHGDFNFRRESHPLATNYWGEVAFNKHGKAIADEILAFILTR